MRTQTKSKIYLDDNAFAIPGIIAHAVGFLRDYRGLIDHPEKKPWFGEELVSYVIKELEDCSFNTLPKP